MKCPQCSLATSDSRDFCPNCALDLRSYKERLGIRARSDTSKKWNTPAGSSSLQTTSESSIPPTGTMQSAGLSSGQSSVEDPFADLTESVDSDVPGSKKGDTLRRRRKRRSDLSAHPLKEDLGDLVSAFEQLQLGGEQDSDASLQAVTVSENKEIPDPFSLPDSPPDQFPDGQELAWNKTPNTEQVLSDLEQSLSSHLDQAKSATESLQAVAPEEPFEDLFEDSRNLQVAEPAEPEQMATGASQISPEVLDLPDDDALLEQQLDAMIGDVKFDVEAVKQEKPKKPARGANEFYSDDIEISFEVEVEEEQSTSAVTKPLPEGRTADDLCNFTSNPVVAPETLGAIPEAPFEAKETFETLGSELNTEPEPAMIADGSRDLLDDLMSSFEEISSQTAQISLTAEMEECPSFLEPTPVEDGKPDIDLQTRIKNLPESVRATLRSAVKSTDPSVIQLAALLAESYGVRPEDLVESDSLVALQDELTNELDALMNEGLSFMGQKKPDQNADQFDAPKASAPALDPQLAALESELLSELSALKEEGLSFLGAPEIPVQEIQPTQRAVSTNSSNANIPSSPEKPQLLAPTVSELDSLQSDLDRELELMKEPGHTIHSDIVIPRSPEIPQPKQSPSKVNLNPGVAGVLSALRTTVTNAKQKKQQESSPAVSISSPVSVPGLLTDSQKCLDASLSAPLTHELEEESPTQLAEVLVTDYSTPASDEPTVHVEDSNNSVFAKQLLSDELDDSHIGSDIDSEIEKEFLLSSESESLEDSSSTPKPSSVYLIEESEEDVLETLSEYNTSRKELPEYSSDLVNANELSNEQVLNETNATDSLFAETPASVDLGESEHQTSSINSLSTESSQANNVIAGGLENLTVSEERIDSDVESHSTIEAIAQTGAFFLSDFNRLSEEEISHDLPLAEVSAACVSTSIDSSTPNHEESPLEQTALEPSQPLEAAQTGAFLIADLAKIEQPLEQDEPSKWSSSWSALKRIDGKSKEPNLNSARRTTKIEDLAPVKTVSPKRVKQLPTNSVVDSSPKSIAKNEENSLADTGAPSVSARLEETVQTGSFLITDLQALDSPLGKSQSESKSSTSDYEQVVSESESTLTGSFLISDFANVTSRDISEQSNRGIRPEKNSEFPSGRLSESVQTGSFLLQDFRALDQEIPTPSPTVTVVEIDSALWSKASEQLAVRELEFASEIELGVGALSKQELDERILLLFHSTDEEIVDPSKRLRQSVITRATVAREIESSDLQVAVEKFEKDQVVYSRAMRKLAERKALEKDLGIRVESAALLPRFGSIIVDSIACAFAGFISAWALFLPTEAVASLSSMEMFYSHHTWRYLFQVLGCIYAIWLFFTTVLLSSFGQTLGCKIFRTEVVNLKGHTLNLKTALLRALSQTSTLLTLGLGLLGIFSKSRKSLHDRMSASQVVKLRESITLEVEPNPVNQVPKEYYL